MKRNQFNFTAPEDLISRVRKKCQEKYAMTSSQYMREVLEAIDEDRLTIAKPTKKEGIYND